MFILLFVFSSSHFSDSRKEPLPKVLLFYNTNQYTTGVPNVKSCCSSIFYFCIIHNPTWQLFDSLPSSVASILLGEGVETVAEYIFFKSSNLILGWFVDDTKHTFSLNFEMKWALKFCKYPLFLSPFWHSV